MADAAAPKTKPAAATPRVDPKIAVGSIAGFFPPTRAARGGNASKYPFSDLANVGDFFSVANKDARQMTSPVSNANKKFRKELTDATGNKTTMQEREFYAVDVDGATAARLKGTPHEGAKVLIVRSK